MDVFIEMDDSHLRRTLDAVRQAVSKPADLLGDIGETLFNLNTDRHKQGLDPDGNPWKPLAPSTIGTLTWNKQDKANRKGNSRRGSMHDIQTARGIMANRRPLWDTGEMLGNSFHPEVIGDSLHLGFNLDRAVWHHAGTDAYTISPKRAKALSFGGVTVQRVNHPGLPARPLVGFPAGDQQAATERAQEYLLRVLEQARG